MLRWLNERDTDSLFLTTVTIAEISYGLFVLPRGKRHSALATRILRNFEGCDLELVNPFESGTDS